MHVNDFMPFALNNAAIHAQSIVSSLSGTDNSAKGNIIGEFCEADGSAMPIVSATIQLLDPVSRSVKLSTNTRGRTLQFYNVPIGNYILVISALDYYEYPIGVSVKEVVNNIPRVYLQEIPLKGSGFLLEDMSDVMKDM